MAKIILPGGYFFETSSNSFNLFKPPGKPKYDKNGRLIKDEAIGYYPSLYSALLGFRKIYGREALKNIKDEISLDRAIEILGEIEGQIDELLTKQNIQNY